MKEKDRKAVLTRWKNRQKKLNLEFQELDLKIKRLSKPKGERHECPRCYCPGIWRHGLHFDNMMRCPDCDETWTP